MRRIVSAVVLAVSILVAPLAAEAQPAAKTPRVGWLSDGVGADQGMRPG
jgi:hypothetical protein